MAQFTFHRKAGERTYHSDLQPSLLASLLTCGKLAGKVTKGEHIAAGYQNCHKCKMVAKHLNCNNVSTGAVQ